MYRVRVGVSVRVNANWSGKPARGTKKYMATVTLIDSHSYAHSH